MNQMNPKIQPGGRGRIPYLLRAAFAAAKQGDKAEAEKIWNLAISEGYMPKSKTSSQFRWELRQAQIANQEDAARLGEETQTQGVRRVNRD